MPFQDEKVEKQLLVVVVVISKGQHRLFRKERVILFP